MQTLNDYVGQIQDGISEDNNSFHRSAEDYRIALLFAVRTDFSADVFENRFEQFGLLTRDFLLHHLLQLHVLRLLGLQTTDLGRKSLGR